MESKNSTSESKPNKNVETDDVGKESEHYEKAKPGSTNNGLASAETKEIDEPVENNKGIEQVNHVENKTRGVKRKATDSEVRSKNETGNQTHSSEHVENRKEHQSSENLNDSANDSKESTDDPDLGNCTNDESGDDFAGFAADQTPKTVSETDTMGKGKRARIPNKRYSDIAMSSVRKSLGSSVKSLDLDMEDILIKEEPTDSPIGSPSLQSSKRQQQRQSSTPTINLQDPKYLKPFKYGWKRELVWRSTSTSLKPLGDIYYYTPTGKKVRSFRELADHLNNRNLTVENFSFCKEPLGVEDPEKEMIRNAKIKSESGRDSPVPPKRTELFKKAKKSILAKAEPAPKVVEGGVAAKRKVDPLPKAARPAKKIKLSPKRGKTPLSKKAKASPAAPALDDSADADATPTKAVVSSTAVKSKTSMNASSSSPSLAKTTKRNFKLRSITGGGSSTTDDKNEAKFMENYLQNLSFGYNTLLYVFQYLKVQDLLRAGCVCTMWRDIASHPVLWRTVRMKNSQVHSFEGLANTLKKHGTVHLDLRKMLLPSAGDDVWTEFSDAIERVDTLRKIELCRCPAGVVERLPVTNPDLEVINAVTIKCESMDFTSLKNLTRIRELRLKSTTGLSVNSIDALKELKTLKILSLTSVVDLHKLDVNVIAELTELESLDLGECTDFPKNFGQDVISKLEHLEKLRLEKGQGNCHTFEIFDAVRKMKKLEQLELVNFDVKTGFDKALGGCHNIKKLMIIPTYISQSATTNNMVLAGVLRLRGSLCHFVWGVTLELLRVTELFVDQCEEPKDKKDKRPTGNGDSIPVLKPVPDLTHTDVIETACNPPQVEILPLPNLQKLLLNSLPTTRVKILKIPFHATWRQTLTDSV